MRQKQDTDRGRRLHIKGREVRLSGTRCRNEQSARITSLVQSSKGLKRLLLHFIRLDLFTRSLVLSENSNGAAVRKSGLALRAGCHCGRNVLTIMADPRFGKGRRLRAIPKQLELALQISDRTIRTIRTEEDIPLLIAGQCSVRQV